MNRIEGEPIHSFIRNPKAAKERVRQNVLSWRRTLHSCQVQTQFKATIEGARTWKSCERGPSRRWRINCETHRGANMKAGNAGKSALSIISQLFSHEYLMRPGDRAPLQRAWWLSQCAAEDHLRAKCTSGANSTHTSQVKKRKSN